MNLEQRIRDLETRLTTLESGDLDMKGRRVKSAGRALAASDLLTLGQARDLLSAPETIRLLEQHVTHVEGGPFGIPVSLGDSNSQGSSGLYADAQHIHASGLTTKGDLLTYSTTLTRLGVGANGEQLYALSTATPGLAWGSGWKGAKVKALTESTFVSMFEVALPSTAMVGGTIRYLVTSTDATDAQAEAGMVAFAGVRDSAGTVTGAAGTPALAQALSGADALTVEFNVATAAGKITFQCRPTTNIGTTLSIRYFLDSNDAQVVTFL